MSNPGVIKLANGKVGNRSVWLDDNIGESIHLHIDDWRIDFSVSDFFSFCDELKKITWDLIDIKGFHSENWDARFMWQLSPYLSHIKEIKEEVISLKELSVLDDEGLLVDLDKCARVRALAGEISIDDTKERKSNYVNETNQSRLDSCLEFVKRYGYPVDNKHIIVTGRRNLIIDGWHRASCLIELYKDKKVPIKRIIFEEGAFELYAYSFPANKIAKDSKIILYGAGGVGKAYYKKIKECSYCNVVAWVDRNYEKLGTIDDCLIQSPQKIKDEQYDYILLANVKDSVKEEIYQKLVSDGADRNCIVY
jgi:hypothetical protein